LRPNQALWKAAEPEIKLTKALGLENSFDYMKNKAFSLLLKGLIYGILSAFIFFWANSPVY
jgi:hypothetical protein